MSNDERVAYRYTAEEQRELDRFREWYGQNGTADDLLIMREIDRQVTRRATARAILIGLAGMFVFGAGLSLILAYRRMIPGIVIGCTGIAAMVFVPTFYERLLRQERRRVATKSES